MSDFNRQQSQVKAVPPYGLRRFFEVLIGKSFQELWIWERELADYVVDLLVRFVRTDAFYRIGNIERKPIHTIAEFLVELTAQRERGDSWTTLQRTRNLRQHMGDYTLFMSGMFRAFLERHGILEFYLVQGSKAYRETAQLDRKLYRPEAQCFEALASEFERLSGALDYTRKVYFATSAIRSPYRDLLDRWERFS